MRARLLRHCLAETGDSARPQHELTEGDVLLRLQPDLRVRVLLLAQERLVRRERLLHVPEVPLSLRDVEEQLGAATLFVCRPVPRDGAGVVVRRVATFRALVLRARQLHRDGRDYGLRFADRLERDGDAQLVTRLVGHSRRRRPRLVPVEHQPQLVLSGRRRRLARRGADELPVQVEHRALGRGVHPDDGRRVRARRGRQRQPQRNLLAGHERDLLRDAPVPDAGDLHVVVAGSELAGIRRGDRLLAVDAQFRVGRIGLDAQLPRPRHALERERHIRVAVRLQDDRAFRGGVSGAADLDAVLACAQLTAPRREPHVLAVDRHARAAGGGRDRRARSARRECQLLLQREILVARHRELDAEVAPSRSPQHYLVATGGDGREKRRAPAFLAVDDHCRAGRIRLDGQRGIFRHHRQHERELHVAARPADDLPLLPQSAGRLHRDRVRPRRQLSGVGRHSRRGAVDEDARLLGFGGDRQRRRATGARRQRHEDVELLAGLDVELLLGAAAVRRDRLDDVRARAERDRHGRLADVVVVDLQRGPGLVGAERRLHRPRGRIVRDADDRPRRGGEARRVALVVARFDEVFEGTFVEQRSGKPRDESASAALDHAVRAEALRAGGAGENERREEARRVLDLRADEDRGAASIPLDGAVLDVSLGRVRRRFHSRLRTCRKVRLRERSARWIGRRRQSGENDRSEPHVRLPLGSAAARRSQAG